MLIVCPNCVSSYRVDPEIMRLSQGGVRCAHCRQVWAITTDMDEREANAEGLSPAQAEPAIHRAGPLGARPFRPSLLNPPLNRLESESFHRLIAVVVMILGMATGAIGWRKPIVQAAPILASLYSLVGLQTVEATLSLQNVTTAMIEEGATPVLTLEGTIQNGHAQVVRVPNIRIVVRDGAEQSLYTWTTAAPKATLAPGERVTFKSRLVSPPGNGHDLQVGFTEAHVVLSDAVVKGSR